jgi:hypothetical protein
MGSEPGHFSQYILTLPGLLLLTTAVKQLTFKPWPSLDDVSFKDMPALAFAVVPNSNNEA